MDIISLPTDIMHNVLMRYLSTEDICSWLLTCRGNYHAMDDHMGRMIFNTRFKTHTFRLICADRPVRMLIRRTRCGKNKLCFGCLRKTTSTHPLHRVSMCLDCSRSLFPTICKSRAFEKYDMIEADLAGLMSVSARNPYGTDKPAMTLYLERDVAEWCDRHRDVIAERVEARALKRAAIQNLRERRRASLEKALGKKGLVLRDDSELCALYIKGRKRIETNDGEIVSLTLAFIVQEMCIMRYLHEYTRFREMVEEEVEEIHFAYDYYPRGVYRMAHDAVKCRIPIPDVFPWLQPSE